ncbi:MAG: short-chain dehydrogenase [Candidatus Marinimicrobia bacterium]|nr:short-chain dehydrogenase [Candidatus Neomarinimicrobiota bacterium]|tara:strand:+ start:8719 stop:9537 length:819 start_codon:yes stop_codon:yes gene_type:complete
MHQKNSIFSLEDRVVIITGGLGQLGKIFIKTVINNGGNAVIFDVYDKDYYLELLDDSLIEKSSYFKVDITKKEEIKDAVKNCVKEFGQIDVLINNAGIDSPPDAPLEEVGPFEDYPEESYDEVMNVNVKGVFLCSQIVGAVMKKHKNGIILNISSIYGLLSPRQDIYNFRRKAGKAYFKPVAYSISKSAIFNLTRYLATYWCNDNIRVNTLTLAGVFNNQSNDFIENYKKNVPLGRMLEPEEIAGPMLFMISNASSYMTGANLIFDGGWSAW